MAHVFRHHAESLNSMYKGDRMENKIKAISVALENELNERDFYLAQSEKTDNPVGKKMFLQIAAEEDEHYRRLQSIYQELSVQGKWPESVANIIGGSDIRKTFRRLAEQAKHIPAANRDDIEALKIAVAFETKGQSFYTRLSSEAGTGLEKIFFELLASMEREHMLTLQDSLLFFENPGDWFAEHEKSQLEG